MYKTIYHKLIKCYFLLCMVSILSGHTSLYAQEADIPTGFTGKIIDEYGNPIPDVEVTLKNSTYLALTGEEGVFEFDYQYGDMLAFKHPAYLYKEVRVRKDLDSNKVFIVSLQEKYIKTGKRIDIVRETIDQESFLGAASSISNDQLTTTLATSIVPALTGRISGLMITQHSGIKGHYTERSNSSDLGGMMPKFGRGAFTDNTQFSISGRFNSPIVFVDGVQRELFDLDPEAIESVTYVKDALSSMKLGMQSSQGALSITTKQPIEQGFKLSFTAKYGFQSPLKKPIPLSASQYAYLLNEALQNDNKEPYFSYSDYEAFRTGSSPYTHPDINWYDQTMKNSSSIQSYNLNVSGGGKVAQYFVSLGYTAEEGLFRTSSANSFNTNLNHQRYLLTSKVNVNVTEDFKVGMTVIGRIEDGNQPGAGYETVLREIYTTPNSAYPIFNPNGSYGGNVAFNKNLYAQTLHSGYMSDNARDVLGNIVLDYDFSKLLEGLTMQGIASISTQSRSALDRKMQSNVFEYMPATATGKEDSYDQYGEKITQSNSYIPVSNYQYMYGQLAIDYKNRFKEHGIHIHLAGDKRTETIDYDLPTTPGNLMARVDYDYANKYFAQAAFTHSYHNAYRPGKRWGSFYAFGLGWDISKENFMDDAEWLDQFKIRGVFGKTGFDNLRTAGYYTWRQSFSTDLWGYNLGTSREDINQVNENDPLANPNLTWEKAYKINIGTDISLFNKQFVFTADYFNDKYFEMLQQRGKSIELIGMSYPLENISKVRAQGIELSLTYQNNIGKVNYFVTANWSKYKSKLLFIDEQYIQEEYNRQTGRSHSANFGLVADGFFKSEQEIANSAVLEGFDIQPGDIKYKDLNNDGVIDQYDLTVISGDKDPCFYGINLGFEYRGFEFSMLFQGAYNREIYVGDNVFMAGFQNMGQSYGQAYSHMTERWTPETADMAKYPRLTAGGNSYNMNPNDWWTSFWVKSGNYIRLKNVYAAYTLPESLSRSYLRNVRVKFFVSGQNLLTKSSFDLVDPEITSFTSYPMQRGFNMGVNLQF